MKRTIVYSAAVALSLSLCSLGLSGCDGSDESESTTPSSPSATGDGSGDKDHGHGENGHGDSDHEDGLSAMEKMKVELAKLSSEDAASALKQHFCPVTGDMLGAMGAPLKVDVNGQQVWICCEDCRDPLLENPDEYLAKLKIE